MRTPVTVLFYRRPSHLWQVLERIRAVRPELLYGVSDGPKRADPEVIRRVEESRKVLFPLAGEGKF